MKAILLLVVASFFSLSSVNAQSETETLEWLNVKKSYINNYRCSSSHCTGAGSQTLTLTSEYLKLSDSFGNWTSGNWSAIKEVQKSDKYYVKVVFSFSVDNKPGYIELSLAEDVRDKYFKAIKHMATLKGAKLVDDDLF